MKTHRRNLITLVCLVAALFAWEWKVISDWAGSTRLVATRITPLDSRHDNRWNDREQRVVSFLIRYLDPTTGQDTGPVISGPVLLREPASGETTVLVDANTHRVADQDPVRERYIDPIPRDRESTAFNAGRDYYTAYIIPPHPTRLPYWIPASVRSWVTTIIPSLNNRWDDHPRLVLFDAPTHRAVATVSVSGKVGEAAFSTDDRGLVVIHSDRCEWFKLPPQIVRDSAWTKALLPPVALALIAFWRFLASRRIRSPLKQPEG